jgi:phosphate-selective porin OprO and OprP
LIDTGNIPADHFTIGNLELATVLGPLCIQSEFYYCDIDTYNTGNQPLYGAYAFLTYSLTGENRNYERFGQHGAQFGRATPYSNMFWVPGCCSLGELEFKIRWSTLDFTSVNSGQYNDLTVGFNWYWSDRIRMLFDWIHPVTAQGTTPFGATVSDIIGMRLDFNW